MRELETPPTGFPAGPSTLASPVTVPDRLVKRRLVLLAVLPGLLITAFAAVVLWLVTADAIADDAALLVLPAGALLAVAVLVTAGFLASSEARSISVRTHELWRMAAWARAEPRPQPARPEPVREPVREPVAVPAPRPRPADSLEQSEVFDHLARRLQSLVHREIGLLDELENQVEDPDLLKGIFRVDHLATRIRRYAENIAVLGGGVSDRMWTRPVSVHDVLRSAVAEIEQYRRVKLVPPVPGMLHGHAVVDVVHLLAELAENATVFSAPQTQVLVRAEYATAGLVVEIEDRGLGMEPTERTRMNTLLATRDRAIPDDLVRDGRIGLFVVAALAKQHGIAVQLQSNIFGGTQAVLVLPHELLADSPPAAAPAPVEQAEPVRVPEPVALPQRRKRTEIPASAHSAVPASAQVAGPEPVPAPVPTPVLPQDPRPSLPTRKPQGHLPAELREPAREAGRLEDVEHSPGLMAAFQSGVRQAEGAPDHLRRVTDHGE